MSKPETGPSAPTRSTEQIIVSDRFQTRVYYAKKIRRFAILDSHARAHPRNWVAVKYLDAGRIAVERFCGQRHFGVVRLLKTFQLTPAGIACALLCIL